MVSGSAAASESLSLLRPQAQSWLGQIQEAYSLQSPGWAVMQAGASGLALDSAPSIAEGAGILSNLVGKKIQDLRAVLPFPTFE